jgi:hypothetical protein
MIHPDHALQLEVSIDKDFAIKFRLEYCRDTFQDMHTF